MSDLKSEVLANFGNRLRVRVCGFLIEEEKVLMVKHKMITKEGVFWAPPGGGLDYGESTEAALKREFLEETGLEIEIVKFLCTHEFLAPPLHGIELFFLVKRKNGNLVKGNDPELGNQQILEEVTFLSFDEVKNLPINSFHNLFNHCNTLEEVIHLNGLYQYIP